MKLLTHNYISSRCLKRVKKGYPLKIEATDVKVTKTEFNAEFISRVVPKIDWSILTTAAESIGYLDDLPKTLPEGFETDLEFLKKAHRVMMEVEVISGDLICPETGVRFPINNGIPNMLVNEDEV